ESSCSWVQRRDTPSVVNVVSGSDAAPRLPCWRAVRRSERIVGVITTRFRSLAHHAVGRIRGGRAAGATAAVPRAVAPTMAAPPATDDVEVLTTLARLDEKLVEVDEAFKVSDDAMRAVFRTFRLELPPASSADPWSEAYRAEQFDFYRR